MYRRSYRAPYVVRNIQQEASQGHIHDTNTNQKDILTYTNNTNPSREVGVGKQWQDTCPVPVPAASAQRTASSRRAKAPKAARATALRGPWHVRAGAPHARATRLAASAQGNRVVPPSHRPSRQDCAARGIGFTLNP